ncbi:hypothetical protein DL771_003370 [Monosporascus sp. 5C6A]|nr:hypothetical protein DL771_003370 [Monosporascus sp. 5C6A]
MATHSSQPETEVTVGSLCAVKKLYLHSGLDSYFSGSWSETSDRAIAAAQIKQAGQTYAIVHRLVDKKGDGNWITHSIEVRSPLLQEALRKVFDGYPGWTSAESPYTFLPTDKPLVHRWKALDEACKAEKDKRTKMELRLFQRELEPVISANLSALRATIDTAVVPFEKLWLVLAPGILYISEEEGNMCASKLVHARLVEKKAYIYQEDDDSTKSYWHLTLAHVDWNGSYCGFGKHVRTIYQPPRGEPIQIFKTGIIPLDLAPNQ